VAVRHSALFSLTPAHPHSHLHVHATPNSRPVVAVRHSASFGANSIYGFFDRGVVQMMRNKGKSFGSVDRLGTLYALGGGTAVELLRTTAAIGQQTVMISEPTDSPNGCGFMDVFAGKITTQDVWGSADFGKTTLAGALVHSPSCLIPSPPIIVLID
jgi:hypothetical protein